MDLGYAGSEFTWWNRRDGQASIKERLDRFCDNVEWVAQFPSYRATHVDERVSDHLPILLDMRPVNRRLKRGKCRRFKMIWVNDDRCDKEVEESWAQCVSNNAVETCMNKVEKCLSMLQHLNWSEYGNVQKEISLCKERSQVDFLRYRDKDTGWFHNKASVRRTINNISELRGKDGMLYANDQDMERIIVVTPYNLHFSLLRVGDLIDSEQRTWREDMVNAIFLPVDAEIIKLIPLSIHLPPTG
ncbi:hypothetical protein Cgig2_000446 [Carnegiea gigantea]|uniref:Uncharacterized protein n=1 Tax=Carnegiea gigantea TaxID=171969 RepID=A0A9Q1GP83_9CARY|nr:hypothetical protein Cgig2_000446 [Carnegiea gigantea]